MHDICHTSNMTNAPNIESFIINPETTLLIGKRRGDKLILLKQIAGSLISIDEHNNVIMLDEDDIDFRNRLRSDAINCIMIPDQNSISEIKDYIAKLPSRYIIVLYCAIDLCHQYIGCMKDIST